MIEGVTLVRPERPNDMSVVRELNDQAFGRPDEGRLVDAVRQRNEPTISLVAVDGNDAAAADSRVIGHLLFSQVTIESPTATVTAIGLGPIAVRPDRQRSGVGIELIRHGLERCREAGYTIVVVLGHPSYYPRFGFSWARIRGIHWEHEVPGDPFMVMELKPGALEGVTGTARYLPEFMSM